MIRIDIVDNVEKLLNNLVKKYNHILKDSTYIDRYTDSEISTDKIRIIVEGKSSVVLSINVDTDLMTDIMSKGSDTVVLERIIATMDENLDFDTLSSFVVLSVVDEESDHMVAEDIRFLEKVRSGLMECVES